MSKSSVERTSGSGSTIGPPLTISATSVLRILMTVAVALTALHLGFYVWHYEVREIGWPTLSIFDLDVEQSLGTWFSALILLLASIVTWLCSRRGLPGDRWTRHWRILSLGLALLSLDEVAGFHETVNTYMDGSWAVPGGFIALAVGIAYIPFLGALPRQVAGRLVAAGAIYVGGAVVIELATEPFADNDELDTLAYNLTTALEEFMEMAGVVVFVFALLAYLASRRGARVEVDITD